jgi:predicted AAA+ superfamily ATPase
VRTVRQVGDLGQFQAFLRLLAARSAQMLNLSGLASDLGLAVNTARAWLSVLEATHQVFLLRPYHANVRKRLVKTPKAYLLDTGTLCHLVGLRDPVHAAQGPMGGAILETAVLAEIVKRFRNRGEEPRVHFWRTSAGGEVDFLVARGAHVVPLEAKLSSTPRPEMAFGIASLRRDLGERVEHRYIVHPGSVRLPLGADVAALPLADL